MEAEIRSLKEQLKDPIDKQRNSSFAMFILQIYAFIPCNG